MSDIPPNTTGTLRVAPTRAAGRAGGRPGAAAPARPGGRGRVWTPSGRLTAILAAAMLADRRRRRRGDRAGAHGSFAGSAELPLLLALADRLGVPPRQRPRPHPSPRPARIGDAVVAPTPQTRHRGRGLRRSGDAGRRRRRLRLEHQIQAQAKGTSAKPLPPVTKVWVVQLNGSGFEEALAQPSAAPYIDSQAIPSGAFLNSWSSLAGADLRQRRGADRDDRTAGRAEHHPAAVPGRQPRALLRAGTPGAVSTADAFLKQTLATITASANYRSNGLIVVTFATIAAVPRANCRPGRRPRRCPPSRPPARC